MPSTKTQDAVINFVLTKGSVKKAVQSHTMSKRYIREMLKGSVTNIIYHRFPLEEKEFLSKTFNNISYKSFRIKAQHPLIRLFHKCIFGCQHALDQHYLRAVHIYFIDNTTKEIVENYKFTFQYAEENECTKPQDGDKLVSSTTEMLQTLLELQKHPKLDSHVELNMELTYFDDTPIDYQPPGFQEIEKSNSCLSQLEKSGNSVEIGNLYTGFHEMKCRGRGHIFNFGCTSHLEAQSVISIGSNATEDVDAIMTEEAVQLTEDLDTAPTDDKFERNIFNDSYVSDVKPGLSEDDQIDDCICQLSDNENLLDKIKCLICEKIYHSPCLGFIDKSYAGQLFECNMCSSQSYDIGFFVEEIVRIRYILGCIYQQGKLPQSWAQSLENDMKNLKKTNVFVFKAGDLCDVNNSILERIFTTKFKKIDLDLLRGNFRIFLKESQHKF